MLYNKAEALTAILRVRPQLCLLLLAATLCAMTSLRPLMQAAVSACKGGDALHHEPRKLMNVDISIQLVSSGPALAVPAPWCARASPAAAFCTSAKPSARVWEVQCCPEKRAILQPCCSGWVCTPYGCTDKPLLEESRRLAKRKGRQACWHKLGNAGLVSTECNLDKVPQGSLVCVRGCCAGGFGGYARAVQRHLLTRLIMGTISEPLCIGIDEYALPSWAWWAEPSGPGTCVWLHRQQPALLQHNFIRNRLKTHVIPDMLLRLQSTGTSCQRGRSGLAPWAKHSDVKRTRIVAPAIAGGAQPSSIWTGPEGP